MTDTPEERPMPPITRMVEAAEDEGDLILFGHMGIHPASRPEGDESVSEKQPGEETTPEQRCPAVHHADHRCELTADHDGLHENNDFWEHQWWYPNE